METLERLRMPQTLPFSKKKLPRRIILSILLIAVTALNAVGPFHQHFALQNYTIQYPFAVHERVPVVLLYFVAVVCPAAVIAFYTLLIDGLFSHQKQASAPKDGRRALSGQYRLKDRLWELNCGILGLLTSNVTAYTITGVLKNATGKPRPDFIDRCRPLQGSIDPPVFGLSNSTICTQTDQGILKDGFKSFPSGHCSTSFAGLFFLSLYLAGKIHILDNRGESWKSLVVLIPTLAAALVAISRIEDARHHPFDALFGSLLGIVVAWYAYRQYFPPLSETWRKGRAYPIHSWASEPMAPNGNTGILRGEGVEPLRVAPIAISTDEEQPRPTMYSTPTGLAAHRAPVSQPGNNVFRQQISQSQRSRQNTATSACRTEPSLDHLAGFNRPHPFDRFAPVGQGGRPMQTDGFSSSSSSDLEEDEEGFQLRDQHPMTDSQSQQPNQHQNRYDTAVEDFGAGTTYHSQSHSANHDPSSVIPSHVQEVKADTSADSSSWSPPALV